MGGKGDVAKAIFGADAVKAAQELKGTVSEARAARKDLLYELRQHRERVAELVHAEVEAQVAAVAAEARARLHAEVDRIVDEIAAELRARLLG